MSRVIDQQMDKFEIISTMRSDINTIFTDIDSKLKILNALHTDLVKTYLDSKYRVGLDSFHFQNRLIQLENDNMKTLFVYIDNRIYCEYYKLYRIICDYISSGLNDKPFSDKLIALTKKFPSYKDLEPTKVYDFNITHEIYTSINQFIVEFQNYIDLKKKEIDIEQKKADSGINIDNLINEYVYKISLIEEKTNMFVRYLNTFHIHHTKYLDRLMSKLRLTNDLVNEDINLKQNVSLQIKSQTKKNSDALPGSLLDTSPIELNSKCNNTHNEPITLTIEETSVLDIFVSDV